MHKFLITIVLMLSSAGIAFGQYLPERDSTEIQVPDITLSKEYKNAKAAFIGGLVVSGIGDLVVAAGSLVCVIEQNIYLNSNASSWTFEEIYRLNMLAKEQSAYKRGVYMELGGLAAMLIGGGIAAYGGVKMIKLRNSSGDTVACVKYGVNPSGIGLAVNF